MRVRVCLLALVSVRTYLLWQPNFRTQISILSAMATISCVARCAEQQCKSHDACETENTISGGLRADGGGGGGGGTGEDQD